MRIEVFRLELDGFTERFDGRTVSSRRTGRTPAQNKHPSCSDPGQCLCGPNPGPGNSSGSDNSRHSGSYSDGGCHLPATGPFFVNRNGIRITLEFQQRITPPVEVIRLGWIQIDGPAEFRFRVPETKQSQQRSAEPVMSFRAGPEHPKPPEGIGGLSVFGQAKMTMPQTEPGAGIGGVEGNGFWKSPKASPVLFRPVARPARPGIGR